ncbi:MAG: OmpA family protein [Tepidisphaeraceae bacterium]
MARMHHRLVGLVAASLLTTLTTGCAVSQEKYNALKLDRDRLAEQLGAAQNQASSAKSEADALRQQIALFGQGQGGKEAMILNLTQTNAELQKTIDELNRRYADAVGKVGSGMALPEALSNELSAFAAQNPDLVSFDAQRGIVKFKSDVTFATGQDQLTPKAKEVISRFSSILNSGVASGYELMVAGHTDNTRVVNPATVQAGHKDNWYLSAHRAISVGTELQRSSVNPQRIAVTGYADQRPVASNASEGGKAQNRRVEVIILPTTIRGGVAPSIASSPKAAPAPRLNKDTPAPAATIDRREVTK